MCFQHPETSVNLQLVLDQVFPAWYSSKFSLSQSETTIGEDLRKFVWMTILTIKVVHVAGCWLDKIYESWFLSTHDIFHYKTNCFVKIHWLKDTQNSDPTLSPAKNSFNNLHFFTNRIGTVISHAFIYCSFLPFDPKGSKSQASRYHQAAKPVEVVSTSPAMTTFTSADGFTRSAGVVGVVEELKIIGWFD